MDLSQTRLCHCLSARRRARELTRFYESKLRRHGLKATQFSILAALEIKGPTPLVELAEVLGLERTSLTRSADRLEEKGWVAEARSHDARQRVLRITPPGRRKLTAAFPAWKEAQEVVKRDGIGGWATSDQEHEI